MSFIDEKERAYVVKDLPVSDKCDAGANPLDEDTAVGVTESIDIDPKKLAAAFRKFDLFVLPVSVVFLVLSSLDRNNVRDTIFVPAAIADP